jgi:hypothetical protein
VPDADAHAHDRSIRRMELAAMPRNAFGKAAMFLRALRRWLMAERRYHPERRYMRGGQARAGEMSARR